MKDSLLSLGLTLYSVYSVQRRRNVLTLQVMRILFVSSMSSTLRRLSTSRCPVMKGKTFFFSRPLLASLNYMIVSKLWIMQSFFAQFMKSALRQFLKMFYYFACKANRRNSLPQQVCVVHKTLPRKTADLIPTRFSQYMASRSCHL